MDPLPPILKEEFRSRIQGEIQRKKLILNQRFLLSKWKSPLKKDFLSSREGLQDEDLLFQKEKRRLKLLSEQNKHPNCPSTSKIKPQL